MAESVCSWTSIPQIKRARYVAVIEDPDGNTYLQPYCEFEDLVALSKSLGKGYKICTIF